ncbi:NB-ARC domain-containing protein [Nocardia salmonicida]|uniref:NB-ARC domain-containing protein n=1 Tax=Nocardia salmonicida TaxID=53431 RepID=UPI00362F24A8
MTSSQSTLLTELRELRELGAPDATPSKLWVIVDQLDPPARVARTTFFALCQQINTPGSTAKPSMHTVEAFVRAVHKVAARAGRALPDEFTKLGWWEGLREGQARPRAPMIQVGRIPTEASAFQVREHREQLRAGIVSSEVSLVTLSGLGGVGKTQLAADYARTVYQQRGVGVLVWADASSRLSVLGAYRELALALDFDVAGSTPVQITERVLVWLETTPKRWLIVFDNLFSPNDIHGLWPPSGRNGQCVITTRSADDYVFTRHGREMVAITGFTTIEAEKYLSDNLEDRPALADDVAGVAADLRNLPLALSHAAAFMATRRITCSEYRTRLQRTARLVDALLAESDNLPDEYERTVAATVAMSLDAADDLTPRGVARPLLEIGSVVHGDAIPRQVFVSEPVRRWVHDHRPPQHRPQPGREDAGDDLEDELACADGLHCLRLLNLATVDDDWVQIHNVVQHIMRDHLGDRLTSTANSAADALHAVWPEQDAAIGATLRTNAAAVLAHIPDDVAPHELRYQQIFSYRRSGDPTTAMAMGEELLEHQGRFADPRTDFPALRTRRLLATCHAETGAITAALTLLRDIYTDMAGAAGAEDPDVLSVRGEIAFWTGETGNAADALAEYQRLASECHNAHGPDHSETQRSRHFAAYWNYKQGNHDQALAECRALVEDRSRVEGPDNHRTRETKLLLIRLLGETTGDATAAVAALRDLLTVSLAVDGPDGTFPLTVRFYLGWWLDEANDIPAAISNYEDMIDDCIRVHGARHPNTLALRAALADLRVKNGDLDTALLELESVLHDRHDVSGPDHPSTLQARHATARCKGHQDPRAALSDYAPLLEDCERVLGADSMPVLGVRKELARCQAAAGDIAEAISTATAVAEQFRQILGPDHPTTRAADEFVGALQTPDRI